MATKYCPECQATCGTNACPMTNGRCAHCGKPPVESAERHGTWLWCATHDQWHRERCAADGSTHCCTPVAA